MAQPPTPCTPPMAERAAPSAASHATSGASEVIVMQATPDTE
eukprot:gene12571-6053_t